MKNILLYDNLHRTKLRVELWKQKNSDIPVHKEIQATANTLNIQSIINKEHNQNTCILLFTESENYFNHVSNMIHKSSTVVKVVWVRWE